MVDGWRWWSTAASFLHMAARMVGRHDGSNMQVKVTTRRYSCNNSSMTMIKELQIVPHFLPCVSSIIGVDLSSVKCRMAIDNNIITRLRLSLSLPPLSSQSASQTDTIAIRQSKVDHSFNLSLLVFQTESLSGSVLELSPKSLPNFLCILRLLKPLKQRLQYNLPKIIPQPLSMALTQSMTRPLTVALSSDLTESLHLRLTRQTTRLSPHLPRVEADDPTPDG